VLTIPQNIIILEAKIFIGGLKNENTDYAIKKKTKIN